MTEILKTSSNYHSGSRTYKSKIGLEYVRLPSFAGKVGLFFLVPVQASTFLFLFFPYFAFPVCPFFLSIRVLFQLHTERRKLENLIRFIFSFLCSIFLVCVKIFEPRARSFSVCFFAVVLQNVFYV